MDATKAEASRNLEQVKTVLEAVQGMKPEDAYHALTHATQFIVLMTKHGVSMAQGIPLLMTIGKQIIDSGVIGGSDASQPKA